MRDWVMFQYDIVSTKIAWGVQSLELFLTDLPNWLFLQDISDRLVRI